MSASLNPGAKPFVLGGASGAAPAAGAAAAAGQMNQSASASASQTEKSTSASVSASGASTPAQHSGNMTPQAQQGEREGSQAGSVEGAKKSSKLKASAKAWVPSVAAPSFTPGAARVSASAPGFVPQGAAAQPSGAMAVAGVGAGAVAGSAPPAHATAVPIYIQQYIQLCSQHQFLSQVIGVRDQMSAQHLHNVTVQLTQLIQMQPQITQYVQQNQSQISSSIHSLVQQLIVSHHHQQQQQQAAAQMRMPQFQPTPQQLAQLQSAATNPQLQQQLAHQFQMQNQQAMLLAQQQQQQQQQQHQHQQQNHQQIPTGPQQHPMAQAQGPSHPPANGIKAQQSFAQIAQQPPQQRRESQNDKQHQMMMQQQHAQQQHSHAAAHDQNAEATHAKPSAVQSEQPEGAPQTQAAKAASPNRKSSSAAPAAQAATPASPLKSSTASSSPIIKSAETATATLAKSPKKSPLKQTLSTSSSNANGASQIVVSAEQATSPKISADVPASKSVAADKPVTAKYKAPRQIAAEAAAASAPAVAESQASTEASNVASAAHSLPSVASSSPIVAAVAPQLVGALGRAPKSAAASRVRKVRGAPEPEESSAAAKSGVAAQASASGAARSQGASTVSKDAKSVKQSEVTRASDYKRYSAVELRSMQYDVASTEPLSGLPDIADAIVVQSTSSSLNNSPLHRDAAGRQSIPGDDKWRGAQQAANAQQQQRQGAGTGAGSLRPGSVTAGSASLRPGAQASIRGSANAFAQQQSGNRLDRSTMGTGMLPAKQHEQQQQGGGGNKRNSQTGGKQQQQQQHGGGARGGGGGRQDQPMDIEIKPLEQSENRYTIQKATLPDAKLMRSLNAILNKLTPEKFDILVQQVMQLEITTADMLRDVVTAVFEKALAEPNFSHVYAEFCVKLNESLPSFTTESEPGKVAEMTFKRQMLTFCQNEFERNDSEALAAIESEDEKTEFLAKRKKRTLGMIRLIGELFVRQMLATTILKYCMMYLFGDVSNPIEENLEALCKLLETTGKQVDNMENTTKFVQGTFEQIITCSQNMSLSSRIRFMLQDLIDLRARNWAVKRKVEVAQKIGDIHAAEARKQAEAEQERLRQDQRRMHGSGSNRPGGPGGRTAYAGMPSAAGRRQPPVSSQPAIAPTEWQMVVPTGKNKSREGSREGSQDIRASVVSSMLAPAQQPSLGRLSSAQRLSQASPAHSKAGQSSSAQAPEGEINTVTNAFDALEIDQPHNDATDDEQTETGASSSTTKKSAAAAKSTSATKSDEDVIREIQSLTKEYFSAESLQEVDTRLNELGAANCDSRLISAALEFSLELKDKQRQMMPKLFAHYCEANFITSAQVCEGFDALWPKTSADELGCDFPLCVQIFSDVLGQLIGLQCVPISYLNAEALSQHFTPEIAADEVQKIATWTLQSVRKVMQESSAFVQLVKEAKSAPEPFSLQKLFAAKLSTPEAVKKHLNEKKLEVLAELV